MRNFSKLLGGMMLTGAALLSQAGFADEPAKDKLSLPITSVAGESTTIRGVFDANPEMQFMLVDIGNWGCAFCRKFADTLTTHEGWLHVFSTNKCVKISVIGDNPQAWSAKYGIEHTYKGNLSAIAQGLAPDGDFSEFPILIFIDRDGNVLTSIQRSPDQPFVDVIESKCNQ